MSSNNIFNTIIRSFEQLEGKPLRNDLLLYFGIVILVYFASFLMMLHEGGAAFDVVFLLPFTIVLTIGLLTGAVVLLATSLIEHFFLLFVDVKKSFEMTVKSAFYALAVTIPLFWAVVLIPNVWLSALLIILFILLTFCGIRVFHSVSIDRAAFVSLATGAVMLFFSYRWLAGQG